ncbi:MAG: excinuclease ABC subunit UvrC, partial [Thermoanaerobaculia bacterium]
IDANLEAKIRSLPARSGIYMFKDRAGDPLYVGKAKSLRQRVLSYLGTDLETRLVAMVHAAVDLDFLLTDSEAEALLLENNWIKRTQPRFNVLLRDDKTYPYIRLTVQEDYPRVDLTRRIFDDGAEYFGPYLPGGLARKAIKLVQKFFEVRVCKIEIDGSLPRPCLYYDMNRCLGPCVDGLTSRRDYLTAVSGARMFLSGKIGPLVRGLRREMLENSAALNYEQSARIRDLIGEIESVSQQRKLSSVKGDDADIYGVHVADGKASVTILIMRGGQVLDRREIFWEGQGGLSAELLLSELLPQVYDRTTFIPKELELPVPIESETVLADWLSKRKGERVYIRYPSRGPKAQRIALATRNARLAHRRRFRIESYTETAGESLADALGWQDPPRRIEGFDISNLHGSDMVASLVVWEEGRMRKSDYRIFNIRGLDHPNDVMAIRQAVERRYRRRLREVGSMPDLIVIDGGRGQLNAALDALATLGVEETPLLSLAKKEEEIFLPELPSPIRLPRSSSALKLLQRIRDEAHRFALRRHRARRSKTFLRSRLDSIRGVGPKRRKLLLAHFGSVAGIKNADLGRIQAVIGQDLGRRVYDSLKEGS